MKKIDINKSTILGTKENDMVDLKLGITGYFSHYSDFETYVVGELEGFTYSEFMTTEENPDGDYGNQWYDYFIPEDKVVFIEEPVKQYRPYAKESDFPFYVGDVVKIRVKNDKSTTYFLINSITYNENCEIEFIGIGSREATAKYWFDSIEICINDRWQAFGVEE